MSTVLFVAALLFLVAMIYAISIQDNENTSNGRDKFVSFVDIENDENDNRGIGDINTEKLSYTIKRNFSLFEYNGEHYKFQMNLVTSSYYFTCYDLTRLSDNTVLGSVCRCCSFSESLSFTSNSADFLEVCNNMVEIDIPHIISSKFDDSYKPLKYRSRGDDFYVEVLKDELYLKIFTRNNLIISVDGYYNLTNLSEESSAVKLYKILCSVSSISVCEDPRKTHWKVFLEHEYELKKIEDTKLKNWVDSVVKKHQEYNDLQYKYETIPAAPIDDIDGFLNFCKIVHEDVRFEEYAIQNYLTQLVNERKLQVESSK